jgi:F0F1-type ATP synthase gamma subunit
VTLELRGANQFAAVAKALKESGDRGLAREFNKALRDSAKPFQEAVAREAEATLPRRGGLNKRVAKLAVPKVRKSNSKRGVGIRLVAVGKSGAKSLARMNRGQVRHPVFANGRKTREEWVWVTQSITPGFWTKAADATQKDVARNMQAALDAVARRIDQA